MWVDNSGKARLTFPNPHLLGDGVMAFLGINQNAADPPLPDLIDRRALAPIRVTGANTLTMDVTVRTYRTDTSGLAQKGTWPAVGSAEDPVPMTLHALSPDTPQSWFRELRRQTANRLELITTYAAGGELTERKRKYVSEFTILDPKPDIVIGSFGIGNDVLWPSTSATTTLQNLKFMLEVLTNAGIICVVSLPPAVLSLTPQKTGKGRTIVDGLYACTPSPVHKILSVRQQKRVCEDLSIEQSAT